MSSLTSLVCSFRNFPCTNGLSSLREGGKCKLSKKKITLKNYILCLNSTGIALNYIFQVSNYLVSTILYPQKQNTLIFLFYFSFTPTQGTLFLRFDLGLWLRLGYNRRRHWRPINLRPPVPLGPAEQVANSRQDRDKDDERQRYHHQKAHDLLVHT